MQNSHPIGVFDSGVGGLTVARAIKDILPYESLYYIGDTANLPYGNKSTKQIQDYVKKIADVLLQQGCKVIVIACSTATAAAAEILQDHVGNDLPVINVIDPIIGYLKQYYPGKTLGLIATQYTVEAATYNRKLEESKANIHLRCLATPLLVPMIEADTYQPHILETYLSDPILRDIQGLILGCTHYWLIKKQILDYFNNKLEILNGAELLALQLKQLLIDKKMNSLATSSSQDYFATTHLDAGFQAVTERLFQQKVYPVTL
ncbi:MAG: glutamate racemase [Candidatus Amoebophilus sp. 36-38]|nr:MAG: glutamate racemase [Candidatus Amoebophilus sp. 36-38]